MPLKPLQNSTQNYLVVCITCCGKAAAGNRWERGGGGREKQRTVQTKKLFKCLIKKKSSEKCRKKHILGILFFYKKLSKIMLEKKKKMVIVQYPVWTRRGRFGNSLSEKFQADHRGVGRSGELHLTRNLGRRGTERERVGLERRALC